MRTDLDPGVHAALATAGYRVTGPLDGSGRGQVWGLAADDGAPAVATVVLADAEEAPTLRERIATLRALRHPHLALVCDVLEPEQDVLVVVTEHVLGTTVLEVARTRGELRPGEAVTLAYPVLQALAALHERGLTHGDVSAANVVLRPDGCPVLVDLIGGARPGELGTAGTASPERLAGAPADAAGDVYAAAALVHGLLAPGSHEALAQLLTAALDPDPAGRPAAQELADAVLDTVEPEPIQLPGSDALAQESVRVAAGEPALQRPGRVAGDLLDGAPTMRRDLAPRHRAGAEAGSTGRRRVALPLVVAGAALGCGAWLLGGSDLLPVSGLPGDDSARQDGAQASGIDVAGAGAHGSGATAEAEAAVAQDDVAQDERAEDGAEKAQFDATTDRSDPAGAAALLTALRAEILQEGAEERLDEVLVPGSAAHAADAQLLERLAEAEVRLVGLRAVVHQAALVEPAAESVDLGETVRSRRTAPTAAGAEGASAGTTRPPATGSPATERAGEAADGYATVLVRSTTSAHQQRAADGTVTDVPERDVVVRLTVRWTADGWRVSDVLPE